MIDAMRRWTVLVALLAGLGASASEAADRQPNAIDYSMRFLAEVRDSPECELTLDGSGRFDFGPTVSNPAMTCPDAFAWRTFVEVVGERFWEDWSTNEQMWPHAPWSRCRSGETASCCTGLERSNDPDPLNCPVFPGPTPGVPGHRPHEPTKAHEARLEEVAVGDADGDGLGEWEDVPALLKNAVIGNEQVELIYHNEPMAEYVFANELYFTEGLARVFATAERAITTYAPHRPRRLDPRDYGGSPPPIDALDLPIDAIMIKADWLDADLAPRLGIDANGEHPFVTMDLLDAGTGALKRFLLLSFHISTKDLPNWFWATFEHVDNQGRCDWTGCNDSFGYGFDEVPELRPAHHLAPPAGNYVPPRQDTNVDGAGVRAFRPAERYASEPMTAALEALFRGAGVGGGPASEPGRPTPADPAWRAYRLKGTQTEFVTARGRPTRLGNSVTEAGFVNSSSCISCHSRAAVTAEGTMAHSIFADVLSDAGLPRSVHGVPDEAWFQVNAYRSSNGQREATRLLSIQTDFVWGFRNACPRDRSDVAPGDRCFGSTTMPTRPPD